MSSAKVIGRQIIVSCDACGSEGVSPATVMNRASGTIAECPWCKAAISVAVDGYTPPPPAPTKA